MLNAYRRRETLGLDEQQDLAQLQIADGVVDVPKLGPQAVYRVPTVNLDTASAATRRGARAQWGAILNALPQPIQVVVCGTPATTLPVERIKAHGSPHAQDLAAWLSAHLQGAQLVARERFLVVPAEDIETLSDRCANLEASMRRIGLPMERLTSPEALRDALSGFLTPRRHQFGPAIVDVSASDRLTVDGECVRALDLGKLPPTIVTDWGLAAAGRRPAAGHFHRRRAARSGVGEIAAGRAEKCAGVVGADTRAPGGARADRGAQDGLRTAADAAHAHGRHGGRARAGQAPARAPYQTAAPAR